MKKPSSVLVLGSGGLRIGQAGEFDYSGSQAIKAFKEDGIRVILMNPNIATVQTDPGLADVVHFLPLTLEHATRVIETERPDAIALSFGGQTALNLGLLLEERGILKKHGVVVLGTPVSAIRDTEDRDLFVRRLDEIAVKTARSIAVSSVAEARKAAKTIGYPVMLRSGFALGGQGSGVVRDEGELTERVAEALSSVPQVLVEEFLGGWKEIEYEVVRDAADNCITVCNMENFDPMGIHTGESIVVAPSQTLSNSEYHGLREVALRTIRHLGIVGECNIQYALNPRSDGSLDYRVIEVNARLSRSSALASKATGYPLAAVAAKLALGYTLPDIRNAITKKTTACFEPSLDYVVVKIPRWDLNKFENAAVRIGSEMKSVGEVMAIGRSFEEALQKGLRMLNIGAGGFVAHRNGFGRIADPIDEIRHATARRIFALATALEKRVPLAKLHALSHIDPWFLDKLASIVETAQDLRRQLTADGLRSAKRRGFSDEQIARLCGKDEEDIRRMRTRLGILPVVKQIDTLAGEFPAETNYLYLTYHGDTHDIEAGSEGYIVLGSGPYAIGSSVEFDWACVQTLRTLRSRSKKTIMINCNPETVSTDYDESDRLYFEELSLERVRDIAEFERSCGAFVSFGGQIPNNLAKGLTKHGIVLMGTSARSIDLAESRHAFSQLLDTLCVDQPVWVEARSRTQVARAVKAMGFPVLVRPSYVLSGAAMTVAVDAVSLAACLRRASVPSDHPVVISKFVENAREIEIDGVAKDGDLKIYAISEHVENAGTHSGDATVVLPPQRTYLETVRRAKRVTKDIVRALEITGPFNIQFLAKENHLLVIECNVRASRSLPFVSKTTGYNFAELAVRAQLGEAIDARYQTLDLDHVGVKSPQFSYARIKGADPRTGVEMGSTGEVACFGETFGEALLLSMQAAELRLPKKDVLVSLGGEENKVKLLHSVRLLHERGLRIHATEGTARFLRAHRIPCSVAKKQLKDRRSAEGLIRSRSVDFIINIPSNPFERHKSDGFRMRRAAIDMNIPLITNRQLAEAFVFALAEAV